MHSTDEPRGSAGAAAVDQAAASPDRTRTPLENALPRKRFRAHGADGRKREHLLGWPWIENDAASANSSHRLEALGIAHLEADQPRT